MTAGTGAAGAAGAIVAFELAAGVALLAVGFGDSVTQPAPARRTKRATKPMIDRVDLYISRSLMSKAGSRTNRNIIDDAVHSPDRLRECLSSPLQLISWHAAA